MPAATADERPDDDPAVVRLPSDPSVDGDPGEALVERGVGGDRPTILLLGSSYVGSFSEAMRAAAVGYGVQIASEAISGVTDFGNNLLFDWREEWSWSVEKWQPDALVVAPFFQVDPTKQCLRLSGEPAAWEACYLEHIERDGVANWQAVASWLDEYDIPVLWVGPMSVRRFGADLYDPQHTAATTEQLFAYGRLADALEQAALEATLQPYESITYFSSLDLFGPSVQAFAQVADGTWFQTRTVDGNMHLCPYGAVQLVRSVMPRIVEGWDTPIGSPWETMGWSWSSQYASAPCSYAPYPHPRYLVDPVEARPGAGSFSVLPVEPPDYAWPALCQQIRVDEVVDLLEYDDMRWVITDVDRAQPWTDPVVRSGAVPPPAHSCMFGIGVDADTFDEQGTVFTETSVTIASYALDQATVADAYRTRYRVDEVDDGVELLVDTYTIGTTTHSVIAGALFMHDDLTWMVRAELPFAVAWAQHTRSNDATADSLLFAPDGYAAGAASMVAAAAHIRSTN